MIDSAFVPRDSLRGQEKTQCILLPAKVKSSRYCMRTKPCKYFEMGHCRFGKKCRFIHNPRGPTTFEYAKLSKEMVHAFDQKFKELHTNFKCMLDKQTEEIIHLKKLLIETLDTIAGKTAENFPLQQESPVPNESDGGKLQKRDPLANTSECKNKDTPTIFVAPNKDASTNDEEISTTTRGLTTKEIKITVKKTSQPLGLVLTVFDGGKGVFIDEIINNQKSKFSIGDQLLKINGKELSSDQDVTNIIGCTKLGEDLQFTVLRSKLLLQAQSLTSKKTRKK